MPFSIFFSPFCPARAPHSLLEKASFSLQEARRLFRPASDFLCHGTKGHTERRKIHRTQAPDATLKARPAVPFLRKEERQKQIVLLYLRYPQQEPTVPAKNAKGILPGRQPDKGSPAISSTGLYPARPSRAVIIFSTSRTVKSTGRDISMPSPSILSWNSAAVMGLTATV